MRKFAGPNTFAWTLWRSRVSILFGIHMRCDDALDDANHYETVRGTKQRACGAIRRDRGAVWRGFGALGARLKRDSCALLARFF
jgi:hypothetical protein